jgi:hypothetical protein
MCAQDAEKLFSTATLPTGNLLSEPGPTFRIKDSDLSRGASFIAYGDQRFTDPANVKSTDPRVRLVEHIAEEKPPAVILNGDVPLAGDVKNDYAVFTNWWICFPEMRNRRWYSAQSEIALSECGSHP